MACHRDRHSTGMSLSGISRELDLDRKTVRRALRMSSWAPYQRVAAAPAMLDAHREWLVERAPQVQYSARIPNSYRLKEKLKAGLVRSAEDNTTQPGGDI
jgi:transposase